MSATGGSESRSQLGARKVGWGARLYWTDLRRRERAAGLATLVLGLGGLSVVLFAPLYSGAGGGCSGGGGSVARCWSASVASEGQPLAGQTVLFLLVMGVLAIVAGITATVAAGQSRITGMMLVVPTALWWIGIFISLASIGVLLVPAGVTAFIATMAASRRRAGE